MKTEHLSTDKTPKNKEEKLDKQLEDSFPTSDPPSFSPGAVGAPKKRKTKDVHEGVETQEHDPHKGAKHTK